MFAECSGTGVIDPQIEASLIAKIKYESDCMGTPVTLTEREKDGRSVMVSLLKKRDADPAAFVRMALAMPETELGCSSAAILALQTLQDQAYGEWSIPLEEGKRIGDEVEAYRVLHANDPVEPISLPRNMYYRLEAYSTEQMKRLIQEDGVTPKDDPCGFVHMVSLPEGTSERRKEYKKKHGKYPPNIYAKKHQFTREEAAAALATASVSEVNPVQQDFAKLTAEEYAIDLERFDRDREDVKVGWFFENFIEQNSRVIIIGGEKAEKSVFAMRMMMCAACGKDWNGYKCPRPQLVLYYDAELTSSQLDSRFSMLMTEFTLEQQALIRRNLKLVCLKQMTNEHPDFSIEYTNKVFWQREAANNRYYDMIVFDALYMFYDEASKNASSTQRDCLKFFERCFKGQSQYVVVHTRKRSNDQIQRSEGLALRNTNVRHWTDQAFAGGSLKKYATTIIGQDFYQKQDGEGGVEYSAIDVKFYSRQADDSPLMTFEFDELEDGNVFRRKLVVNLGEKVMRYYMELKKHGGPWDTKRQVAKSMSCSMRTAYSKIDELTMKGYLVVDPETNRIHLAGTSWQVEQEMEKLRTQSERRLEVRSWLNTVLPGSPLYTLTPISSIRSQAKIMGFEWEDVLWAKKEINAKEGKNESAIKCWHQFRPPAKKFEVAFGGSTPPTKPGSDNPDITL